MTVTDHYISAKLTKLGFPVLKPQIRMFSDWLTIVPTMLKRWATHGVKKPATRSKPHESWKSTKVTHDFRVHLHRISPAYSQLCPQRFRVTVVNFITLDARTAVRL
jgi:hypothetical protein